MLQDRLELSERRACEIAEQHRSTQRREPQVADDDQALRARLRKLSAKKPRWGYRRAHGHLLSEGWQVNRKRVQRIWREEGLRVPARKRKRHTPNQVIGKLREAERMLGEGKTTAEVAKALEISENTFHRWRKQYGGMKANDAKRLKELEKENVQLKRLVADKELEILAHKEISRENF